MGPFGRWLLVNPPSADSLWLVDLASNRFVAGFETEWSADLPTVTNQQTLLLKSGGDVVAIDLTQQKLPVTGRVKGGAKDYWLHACLVSRDRAPRARLQRRPNRPAWQKTACRAARSSCR